MYGRADGMPSFQLTVAVRAVPAESTVHHVVNTGPEQVPNMILEPKHLIVQNRRRLDCRA